MSVIDKKIATKLLKVDEALQKAKLLEQIIEELTKRINAIYFGLQEMQESMKKDLTKE